MNISFDDDKVILKFKETLDIENIDEIKNYLKNIFLKLKEEYSFSISGLYLVVIYEDINNTIIEIESESDDIYDYYDEVDMHLMIENTICLYEIEDVFFKIRNLNKYKIFKYLNKYYLKLEEKIDKVSLGKLYEFSKLKYKNTKSILKYGKEIHLMI